MALEYGIGQLIEEYEKTKDKRYKVAADVLRGVKKMIGHDIPLDVVGDNNESHPKISQVTSEATEVPFALKKQENALASIDMQDIATMEANRLSLESAISLKTDFYNTEFNLEISQEEPKEKTIFSRFRREKKEKILVYN